MSDPAVDGAPMVIVERHHAVALVQLNREDALNAMSSELLDELIGALEELDRNPDVRAVVIAGHDRAFAAGGDLKAMRERELRGLLVHITNAFWKRLAELRVPLVAAVSGYAFGGGCELALACDLVVASETALFSVPEILVGILPGGGGTQRLARTIGKQKAMEMVLTGRRVSAEEAERLGMVNRVTAADAWLEGAMDLAREIAERAPLAVILAKRAVLAAEESTLATGISFERRLYELAMATEDRREGMDAFIERRPPTWQGR
jgi:enoyl-CoA hydratase/carnithine racemase